jgi:hypothetical protein
MDEREGGVGGTLPVEDKNHLILGHELVSVLRVRVMISFCRRG